MTRDLFWLKSLCIGTWLHRYIIVRQYGDGIEERCQICGDQQIFKMIDGRADNLEYIDYHMRQVLFPQHPLFHHEYKYHPYE